MLVASVIVFVDLLCVYFRDHVEKSGSQASLDLMAHLVKKGFRVYQALRVKRVHR